MDRERLTLVLAPMEMQALRKSAKADLRHPRDQARYLLRRVLLGETVQEHSKVAGVMNVSEASTTNDFASVNP